MLRAAPPICLATPIASKRRDAARRFMKLHAENATRAPFAGVKMISAADYAAALRIPGDFNWHKAARTLLVHLGLNFLLPLTTLAGGGSAQEDSTAADAADAAAPDPLAAVGGSDTVYAVLRDSLSPLHLYAIGALRSVYFDLCCRLRGGGGAGG